jgi:hypothetical protein
MAPNCLDNYVGVKCLTPPPRSGYYINDLEGLNLRYAADIADSDYVSGLEFLRSKIAFATELVLSDIVTYTLPYFRINSIIDELTAGKFKTNFLPPAPADRGFEVKVRNSRLLRIRLRKVEIRILEANTTSAIIVTDGNESFSFPFTTDSNGFAEIFPDYLSKTDRILVTLNDTAINVLDSQIKTCGACSSISGRYLYASGWNGTSTSSSSYGLSIDLNAECSLDEIACILSPRLGLPILYRSGIEVVKEAITTDRLNSVTLLDSEKGEFLLDSYSKEYDKLIKGLIESIPLLFRRIDDCCVLCNQSRYGITIP